MTEQEEKMDEFYKKMGFDVDEKCTTCNAPKWVDPKDGYRICLNGCSLKGMKIK